MNDQPEKGRLVFVVHKHQATTLHDDVRLKIGGVMRTSAIPKGPTLDPRLKRRASPTTDHALDYRHARRWARKFANMAQAGDGVGRRNLRSGTRKRKGSTRRGDRSGSSRSGDASLGWQPEP